MNLAFYRASERLETSGRGRALWTVHDEGLLSVKKEHWQEELAALVANMGSIGAEYGFKIPLKSAGYGPLDFWQKA